MSKGIDVSVHNGSIDFAKVKQSGIDFVIIRVGWIGNKNNHTKDVNFETYYKNAKANGLKVGCYVYSYVENETAMNSAINWVKEQIQGKSFEYPIFLDVEDKQINYLSVNLLTNLCKQFCNAFENSGVYANKSWFKNKLDVNELLNYKIWLAEWNGRDEHTASHRVDIWQYTSSGQVEGIGTNTDMNISYLNVENNNNNSNNTTNEGSDFEVETWQNGSTNEPVYQDLACTTKIGTIYPREYADCYGIINGVYLVVYYITNKSGKVTGRKAGFVKYNGGVK